MFLSTAVPALGKKRPLRRCWDGVLSKAISVSWGLLKKGGGSVYVRACVHVCPCTHMHKGPPILYIIFKQNAFLSPQLTFWAKDVWLNQFKQQHGIWQQSISVEIKPAATKSIDPFSYWFVNLIKNEVLECEQIQNAEETGFW